jgi:hypothetical protein
MLYDAPLAPAGPGIRGHERVIPRLGCRWVLEKRNRADDAPVLRALPALPQAVTRQVPAWLAGSLFFFLASWTDGRQPSLLRRTHATEYALVATQARNDGYVSVRIGSSVMQLHRLVMVTVLGIRGDQELIALTVPDADTGTHHVRWRSVEVDHINNQPGDNRVANLRLCEGYENKRRRVGQDIGAVQLLSEDGLPGQRAAHERFVVPAAVEGAAHADV